MGKIYPSIWFICDCLEDLKRAPAEDRWSLFLLLLLLGTGFDRPVDSCPDDSGLSPSLSLTGVFLWDSYIGLAIDVVPILSSIVCLGGESNGFSPILSLTGVFLWASLLVAPSLSLTGVFL